MIVMLMRVIVVEVVMRAHGRTPIR
jgi:hypothetical protein